MNLNEIELKLVTAEINNLNFKWFTEKTLVNTIYI
jgi:hypothetical protein